MKAIATEFLVAALSEETGSDNRRMLGSRVPPGFHKLCHLAAEEAGLSANDWLWSAAREKIEREYREQLTEA
jgi:predicted HicB family RNase H-like nuclease